MTTKAYLKDAIYVPIKYIDEAKMEEITDR